MRLLRSSNSSVRGSELQCINAATPGLHSGQDRRSNAWNSPNTRSAERSPSAGSMPASRPLCQPACPPVSGVPVVFTRPPTRTPFPPDVRPASQGVVLFRLGAAARYSCISGPSRSRLVYMAMASLDGGPSRLWPAISTKFNGQRVQAVALCNVPRSGCAQLRISRRCYHLFPFTIVPPQLVLRPRRW